MFISFFESIKYLGHLWPIALLRMYLGYFFLNAGLDKLHKGFLEQPILPEILNKWIEQGGHNPQYVGFLQSWVLPHWQTFSYMVVFGEIAVGVSYLIGFMFRPAAVGAIFLCANFMLAAGPEALVLNKILIAVNLALLFLSAGRCMGFDYYFYKRVRGIWW